MNLKELQIYGFKSFSDKVSLKFDNPITGIVGPNGCGKSNVVDAIRWVLGEQSAKGLRGKTMHDLIFSGTEQRKSMSYCEVSIIMDNTKRFFPFDLDEVIISRKLYRSNESEYMLNRNNVRLKDVTDALREAGLGKEGYSIVGQGRMDAILASRPEDRRAIFEEALGISKFRARKIETERKLEKTRDNIIRLHDILTELERQLVPLKRQANDAKKYLAVSEELKYHEINAYIYTYDNASDNKNAIKARIKAIEAELEKATQRHDEAFALYNKLFTEMTDTDATVNALRNRQLQLSVQIERYSGELRLLNERVRNTVDSNSRLTKEIDELRISITNIDNNINNLVKLIAGLKEEEKTQSVQLATLNAQHFDRLDSLTALQETLDKRQQEVLAAADKLSAHRSKTSVVSGEARGVSNRITSIEKDIAEAETKISQLVLSQSKEIEQLLNSNFEQTTTLQMAEQIDGYVNGVNLALGKMSLDKALTGRLLSLVGNISEKSKQELHSNGKKAENWQQNMILMSVLSERLAKFASLQETRQEHKNKLLKDLAEQKGRLKALEQSLAISKIEEETLLQGKTDAQAKANEIQRQYAVAKAAKDKIQEDINACKLKALGLSSNIQSSEARLTSYKQTMARYNMDIAQKTRQIETNELHLKDLYAQIEQSGGNAEDVAQLNEITIKLQNADTLKKEVQTKLAEADHQRQYYNAEVQQISDNKMQAEFDLTRIDDDIAAIQTRIQEQYDLTYTSAMRFKDEEYDFAASKDTINRLRAQIARLGYYNPSAIEDYENTQTRYDQITAQVDDLRKAEADLNKFLKDITREMTVRFNDGFEIINFNFGTVFKELFAGGHARMTIERDENKDELDFGIEIEAQPPGKRLQNISLLSGGERTLTSVAILFAILKLRPMPFCVLDEIEAALDDANAERIANYIKKFSAETQFIVVTHKKPTMESCDVLYGVTMEEKGVSKTVSVQLTDISADSLAG